MLVNILKGRLQTLMTSLVFSVTRLAGTTIPFCAAVDLTQYSEGLTSGCCPLALRTESLSPGQGPLVHISTTLRQKHYLRRTEAELSGRNLAKTCFSRGRNRLFFFKPFPDYRGCNVPGDFVSLQLPVHDIVLFFLHILSEME